MSHVAFPSDPRSGSQPVAAEHGPVVIAGLRGLVAGIFSLLSAVCLLVWIAVTPQLRALGRAMVLDAQLVMVLAAAVVAVVALLLAWSQIGRGMVAAVGLVVAGQGVLATVMGMGGLVITGRPGPPAPVSLWPIMAAMLGMVAVVLGVWRSPDEVLVGRRQLIGSWVATLLAVAAVGTPAMPLSVAGAAPTPVMTLAGPYVGQAMTGILVILLATAGLRASRSAAVGQAVATMALMAAAVWMPALVPGVVDTRPKGFAVVLAALAVLVWSVTAGSREWVDGELADQEWHDDVVAGMPPVMRHLDPHPRTTTAVLEPVGDGSPPRGHRPHDDPTAVVHDRDQTEVMAATDDRQDRTEQITDVGPHP